MNKTLHKSILYSIIGLLYISLLVPLLISTSLFFPYITGKAFLFRGAVELAALLYIVLVIFDKRYLPKRGLIMWSVLAFTAVLGIACFFAEDPAKSFWSNYERMEGYVTVIHLFLFFVVSSAIFRTKQAWERLLKVSVVVSVIVGFRAFADYDTSRDSNLLVETMKGVGYFVKVLFGGTEGTIRIAGSLGNSSYLGVYSLLHTFIGASLLIQLKSIKKFIEARVAYIGYIVAILFNLFVLYNTGTRGSFVGLVAGVFVFAIIPLIFILSNKVKVDDQTKKVIKKTSIIVVACIVVIVGFLGINKNADFVKRSDLLSRFSSLITFDLVEVMQTQGKARTLLWGMAWEGVKERPLLGWGQDNFHYVFAKYYDPQMYGQEQWFDRTHNVFLDWLIAGGVLGLAGYLSLFVALLLALWKKVRLNKNEMYDLLQKALFTGLLVAYFVHNLFIFDNLVSYIIFFILLAYIHEQSMNPENMIVSSSQDAAVRAPKEGIWFANMKMYFESMVLKSVLVVLVILISFYSMYTVIWKPIMAGRTLIKALQISQPGALAVLGPEKASPANVLTYFKQALAYNTFGNTEIRERLAETTPTVITNEKDQEVVKGFTDLLGQEFDRAIKETPNDPRPYIFVTLYLQKFGLFNQSLPYVEKAISLSPNKQSFIFQKGVIELSTNQFTKAAETFKTAYELAPESDESKLLYAMALVFADKFSEAKTIIGDNLTIKTDERYLNALLQKKQYTEIITIAKEKEATDPSNPQVHMSLAGLYLKMGRRAEAIAEIQKTIALAPDFKEAGEQYIQQIREGKDPSAGI